MTGQREVADDQWPQDGGDALDYAIVIPANRIPFRQAPVEHLFADIMRIRMACDLLHSLAKRPGAANPGLPAMLGRFFRLDFALHCDDGEKDLLPLLERRLVTQGVTDRSPNRLRAEHAADRDSLQFITPLLDGLAQGLPIHDLAAWEVVIESFTVSVREHLAWEDSALRVLAESHLTAADCEALAAGMARRRLG